MSVEQPAVLDKPQAVPAKSFPPLSRAFSARAQPTKRPLDGTMEHISALPTATSSANRKHRSAANEARALDRAHPISREPRAHLGHQRQRYRDQLPVHVAHVDQRRGLLHVERGIVAAPAVPLLQHRVDSAHNMTCAVEALALHHTFHVPDHLRSH
ncbi:hypothetical protein PsYK624_166260 [Phanerochaete sordida]|uniref:Uncharacterized protein n=1 Tax=Phanerochaete sordida TaxID=48140 RepID=A0A9P3GR72_9APHY|nr:hypothetical protein PsYK624_166260 [Phanerochaete sordida]